MFMHIVYSFDKLPINKSMISSWLFAPIFLFHGRQLDDGGIQADDLQVDAAIRANDNLTHFSIGFQADVGFAFGTSGDRHYNPPDKSLLKAW
jgi:hypothetical protein